MNAAEFILIQVFETDEFYELARIRPYFNENDKWDEERGWYCEGFGQHNNFVYEFSLHLGKTESDIKQKFINLGFPVKNYNGEKVRVTKLTGSNRPAIWSTECPSCKTGMVLLYEKGGFVKCDKCKKTYLTDYKDHPELETPRTEYWLIA